MLARVVVRTFVTSNALIVYARLHKTPKYLMQCKENVMVVYVSSALHTRPSIYQGSAESMRGVNTAASVGQNLGKPSLA